MLVLGVQSLLAQDIKPPHLIDNTIYQKQIGVNVTDLLANLINFSSSNSFTNPVYYVTWRKLGENSNKRRAIGGSIETIIENENVNSNVTINFKFGKERFKNFARRWQVYYGWDFLSHVVVRVSGSSEQIQLAVGAAPLVGLQLQLNKRLSISAETAYNMLATFGVRNGNVSGGIITNFSPPSALYLNYKF